MSSFMVPGGVRLFAYYMHRMPNNIDAIGLIQVCVFE